MERIVPKAESQKVQCNCLRPNGCRGIITWTASMGKAGDNVRVHTNKRKIDAARNTDSDKGVAATSKKIGLESSS